MKFLKIFISILALGFLFSLFVGCGHLVPPSTSVVLVNSNGEKQIKEKGAYNAGGSTSVYFIDTKLQSYSQDLKITCADNIELNVKIKWIGSIKITQETFETIEKKIPITYIKQKNTPGSKLLFDRFLEIAMEDILRNIVWSTISPYKTAEALNRVEKLQIDIKQKFVEKMELLKYPLETADILIENINYSKEIVALRKEIQKAKVEEMQSLARVEAEKAKIERASKIALEKKIAEIREAKMEAKLNKAKALTLEPGILAVKQLMDYLIETLDKLSKISSNHTP